MNYLVIDSATRVLYGALVKDDMVVSEKYIKGENDHAKNIVLMIEELLDNNGLNIDNINRIVVGVGPGSYTGVRMAVVIAKMLCTLKQIELYKVSTLFLMASGYKERVVSLIDARRGNAFSSIYLDNFLLLSEGLREKESIPIEVNDVIVTESDFIVDPLIVIKEARKVDDIHTLVPNYLRETEATRNLKNGN